MDLTRVTEPRGNSSKMIHKSELHNSNKKCITNGYYLNMLLYKKNMIGGIEFNLLNK